MHSTNSQPSIQSSVPSAATNLSVLKFPERDEHRIQPGQSTSFSSCDLVTTYFVIRNIARSKLNLHMLKFSEA